MQRILTILVLIAMFFLIACLDQKNEKKSAEDSLEFIFKIEDKITAYGKIRDRKAAEKLLEKVSPTKIVELSPSVNAFMPSSLL